MSEVLLLTELEFIIINNYTNIDFKKSGGQSFLAVGQLPPFPLVAPPLVSAEGDELTGGLSVSSDLHLQDVQRRPKVWLQKQENSNSMFTLPTANGGGSHLEQVI